MRKEHLQSLLALFAEFVEERRLEHRSRPPRLKHKQATCGAQTRRKVPCHRKALANGRCPNHGGLSSGPKTAEGRERIAEAQRARWTRWRSKRLLKGLK